MTSAVQGPRSQRDGLTVSTLLLAHVWKDGPQSGSDLLVLMALADIADDWGRCFPKQSTIATKARLTDRAVRSALVRLAEQGWLSVEPSYWPNGKQRSSLYRISLAKLGLAAPVKAPGGDPRDGETYPEAASALGRNLVPGGGGTSFHPRGRKDVPPYNKHTEQGRSRADLRSGQARRTAPAAPRRTGDRLPPAALGSVDAASLTPRQRATVEARQDCDLGSVSIRWQSPEGERLRAVLRGLVAHKAPAPACAADGGAGLEGARG